MENLIKKDYLEQICLDPNNKFNRIEIKREVVDWFELLQDTARW
jgi:hypothetical protein